MGKGRTRHRAFCCLPCREGMHTQANGPSLVGLGHVLSSPPQASCLPSVFQLRSAWSVKRRSFSFFFFLPPSYHDCDGVLCILFRFLSFLSFLPPWECTASTPDLAVLDLCVRRAGLSLQVTLVSSSPRRRVPLHGLCSLHHPFFLFPLNICLHLHWLQRPFLFWKFYPPGSSTTSHLLFP